MTRQALALSLLEEAGPRGVTTAEFMDAGVGSRYSARIMELRKQGHSITSERVREGSWRYTLDVEVGGVSGDIRKPDRGAADLSVERVCRHCRVPQRVGRPACACEEDGPVWVEAESLKLFESAA